jgi:hypothetical protein
MSQGKSAPSRHDPVEEFEVAFGPLLQGTLDMFSLEEATKDEDGEALKAGGGLEDILKVYVAEDKIKEGRKRARETVEVARNDLRGSLVYPTSPDGTDECARSEAISRVYEQQKLSTTRSSALPTPEEHEARMASALADRRLRLKQNGELEQGLYRYQAELARLQHELKDEEADAFEVSELNGEVFALTLFRFEWICGHS